MEEARGADCHGRSQSLSPSPSLNLVLIGEREAGKSAVGNAVLGTKAFDEVGMRTRVSVRREGMVRGQRVLVVDTPGWEWFNLGGSRASPEHVRKQMVASMKLCHPGAHALLLVVPLSFSFSSRERRVAEEHVELFGPQAWSHTLVLFTVKDTKQLHPTTIQEEVEDNAELEKLVEKCGRRYHALYSQTGGGEDLVAKLLAKIQAMVSANGESVILSEEVMKLAREREEEEERQEEVERKEKEEKVRRWKEALRKKEMEEGEGSEDEEEEEMEGRRRRTETAESFEAQDSSEILSSRPDSRVCCKTQ
ncbi:GTPase IMAP family member 4-like [Colossoma macropomum]|uniref:GTPase IMAP family member 4-like n=1 Tax=Colossoma macropomum TaxID=42526 RepID=UPI0018654704|nr:GTPase IMAP family member 4-like [Colossoma macropomum]